MKKPKDIVEIKLSEADVEQAIEDWLDKGTLERNFVVLKVEKTQSKKWFLIATFE